MRTIFYYPPESPEPLLLEVTCATGTSGQELAQALAQGLGLEQDLPWERLLEVDQVALAQLTWGEPPLVDGAVLTHREEATEASPRSFCLTAVAGPDTGRFYLLDRGSYSLGKNPQSSQLVFEDQALQSCQGSLVLDESGLGFSSASGHQELALETPFDLGNSSLLLTRTRATGSPLHRTVDLSPLELEVPPPRSSWIYLLMMLMPLAIGSMIASMTGMWLFMLMALASSLLMGVHWFTSRGESRKTQRLLAAAAETDLNRSRQLPSLLDICRGATFTHTSGVLLLVGTGHRPARLTHRNMGHYRLPLIGPLPLALTLEAGKAYGLDLPLPTLRALLLGLVAQGQALAVLGAGLEPLLRRDLRLMGLYERHRFFEGQAPPKREELAAYDVLLVSARTWAEHHRTLEDFTVLVCGTFSEPGSLKAVLKAEGAYGEKLGVKTLEAAADLEGWDCWLDGISQPVFLRALGGRSPSVAGSEALADFTSDNRYFGLPNRFLLHSNVYAEDLEFYLGQSQGRALTLCLTKDGPHWLLAGTTGSGKSQLLTTLLLSAVLRYPPQRLSLVLIDFKGGATLGPFAALPHTSTVLSDLEAHQLDRALGFLRADLVQREKVFKDLGVSDYRQYLAHHRQTQQLPAFPELLIAVDEFKMLVDQFPAAMTELMKVATVGRSLGVHLLLATQRPQGAVSQDIRANIALSICLRVASPQDSHNVLGSDLAASIPASRPGSGYLATGEGEILPFQAPLFNGLYTPAEETRVRLRGQDGGVRRPDAETGLVQALAEVARTQLTSAGYQPLPPALPRQLALEATTEGYDLGLGELPDLALRQRINWQPETDGSLALLAPSSQRSDLLASLLKQAHEGGRLTLIFAADHLMKNHFQELAEAGAVSGLLGLEDLTYLEHCLDELLRYRQPTKILLVFDALDIWLDSLTRFPTLENKLHQLLREGNRYGLEVCATSTQPLRGKTSQSFASILWSADTAQKDPFKKGSKDFPALAQGHLAVEGELSKKACADPGKLLTLAPVCLPQHPAGFTGSILAGSRPLEGRPKLFEQLPTSLPLEKLAPKPQNQKGRRIYLGTKAEQPLLLEIPAGRFIPLLGPQGSGKSTLLNSLRQLNPEWSYLYLPGKKQLTLQQVTEALEQVPSPEKTIILLDDAGYLDPEIQRTLMAQGRKFTAIIFAYTPWPRWHTSPILTALQGCSHGLALMPEAKDLDIFAYPQLPPDLLTRGSLYPGRCVLFAGPKSLAFQAPIQNDSAQKT